MSTEAADPLAVVRAIIAAWDARDFQAVLALFSDDAVLHSMMIEPIVGKASIEARLARLKSAKHHATLTVQRMGVIDGRVFVERVDVITLNGRESGVPVVGVFEVEAGRVKVWREYYDRRQLLAAMGIVEDFDREAR
jgi:limonene-1,2-epoxide hydrolase